MKHPFLGISSDYVWCLHCERVYPALSWANNRWDCPAPDCDGGPLDTWEWNQFLNNPDRPGCPEHPDPGFSWPLYP